jgi:hypothetical protein
LPVPVSPSISTLTRVSTTFAILSKSGSHRARVADDPLELLLRALLEEGVLRAGAHLRQLHLPVEPRVVHRQARLLAHQHQQVEVAVFEHPGLRAVVHLQHPEDLLAPPERHPHRGQDLRPHDARGLAHLAHRVGGQHRRALLDHLAHDALGDGHRLAALVPRPRTRVVTAT